MTSEFFLGDAIEVGNGVIKLFNDVPVICFESLNFFGFFCEVDLILSGVGLFASGVNEFLHERERLFLRSVSASNYRNSWFAGRVLAKSVWFQLNQKYLNQKKLNQNQNQNQNYLDQNYFNQSCGGDIYVDVCKKNFFADLTYNRLCIISRDSLNRVVSPVLFIDGAALDCSFSISHIDSHVVVFFAKGVYWRVGCDLVEPDAVTDNMQQLFYNKDEIDSIHNPNKKPSIQFHKERIWSVKETAFKILGGDRSFKPEQWSTEYIENGCYKCKDANSPNQKSINIRTIIAKNKIIAIGIDKKISKGNFYTART
ncbi:MAG: hypothetical protein LBP59_03365 [Planctomycetaceae bacterium]|jgi:hypothetical protein|nr:hypothetical protein [Planctomycetaceae bacterium]